MQGRKTATPITSRIGHMALLVSAGFIAVVGTLVTCRPATAQPTPDQPFLLDADSVNYDEGLGVITARGTVELAGRDRVVRADTLSYNRNLDIVTASGNVMLLEPSGDVLFAEFVELTGDLREGAIDRMRVLLSDDSRFAAASGVRRDGNITELTQAVYSPCALCEDDPERPPLWQIKASRIIHDEKARDIEYRDARLEFFGVPVAYSPYFRHPDPGVRQRSGTLPPRVGHDRNLGFFLRGYQYFDLDTNRPESQDVGTTDLTAEALLSEDLDPLLGGVFRHHFNNGALTIRGALSYTDRAEGSGATRTVKEDVFRGYYKIDGKFDIDDKWRWGVDLHRTTDNNFLRLYDYADDDILTSRLYAERFNRRDYARIEALSFQDLRTTSTLGEGPLLLPSAEYYLMGDAGQTLGGRWNVELTGPNLVGDPGNDVDRVMANLGWERTDYLPGGLVHTLGSAVRLDGYFNDERVTSSPGDDAKLRPFGYVTSMTRLPLARPVGTARLLIEPSVELRAAPNVGDNGFSSQNAAGIEFGESNLFSNDRYRGLDLLDDGSRITYGNTFGVYGAHGGASTLFLGQSYAPHIPNRDAGSGLDYASSDYVTRLKIQPSARFSLDWRARYDRSDLTVARSDVIATIDLTDTHGDVSYTYVDGVSGRAEREEVSGRLRQRLWGKYWWAEGAHRRSLTDPSGSLVTALGLRYLDECFDLGIFGERDFSERDGLENGDTVYVTFTLRNLGDFGSAPSLISRPLNN